jgi:hypothetical protein
MKTEKNSPAFVGGNGSNNCSNLKGMNINRKAILLALLAFVCFGLASMRANTIYVTADNAEGTNLFGTLNVATGQFNQIATTDRFLAR